MDETEEVRQKLFAANNAEAGSREDLEAKHGQVWDTTQLRADFEVVGFGAPFVEVVRKSDRAKGSLEFQHDPRFYWGFTPITS